MKALSPTGALCFFLATSTYAHADSFEVGSSFGYGRAGSRFPVAQSGGGGFLGTSASVTAFQRLPVAGVFGATFGGGPTARLFAGYRFLANRLSIGLTGGGRASSSDAPGSASNRIAFSIGPYARFYPMTTRRFEPWISIGLEYTVDRFTALYPSLADIHLTHHGIAIPLGVGVDYRLSSIVSLGPSLQIARVLPLSACYEGPAGNSNLDPNTGLVPTSSCSSPVALDAQAYTTWSVSLGLRVSP